MRLMNTHPVEYFNRWLSKPIELYENSVAGTIGSLNSHPMTLDETAQDFVMPTQRCREKPGRFSIFVENQDTFRCFVYENQEHEIDPPVYFESSLDLEEDYGVDPAMIIDNDHTLISERFSDFLWQMLGQHICLRMEYAEHFAAGVNGLLFDNPIQIASSFYTPLKSDFVAGYTCSFQENLILIPQWGAAFIDQNSRDSFVQRYNPAVKNGWGLPGL